MQATNQRAWQARLALMLIVGVAAAAACVVTLMLWKAPAASGQEEPSPTGANFVVRCGFSHRAQVDPIVDFGKTAHHMHDFFGNTTTSANSTLESLRAAASRSDHGTLRANRGLEPPLETQRPTGYRRSLGPTAVAPLPSRPTKHSSTTGRI